MSFQVITFLRSVASGNDRPTTPIMKAIAVPRATPFWTNASIVHYMEDVRKVKAQDITLDDVNNNTIYAFLKWLENERKVSVSTRNQRLAAFKSFAGFLKRDRPDQIAKFVMISNLKPKATLQKEISYLKPEGIKLLLDQVPRITQNDRRDYTMLTMLYTTAIRVSELIGIRGTDISLSHPKSITIHGKGRKTRIVPIVKPLAKILEEYLKENKCLDITNINECIFRSHTKEQFTRQGVNYMLKKYADKARMVNPALIPKDCSPHKLRHSCAMALLEEGVDLIVIRDLLGHSSVQTTEIYARVSSTRRRNAIEAASKEIVPQEEPLWETNTSIKNWLKSLTDVNIM